MNAATGTPAARFTYRNPLDLPRITLAGILANSAEGVYVEAPGQPRIFHRAPPAFHDDPDHAGVFEPFGELDFTYPPVFTVSLQNVSLAGFRSVLSRDGFFISDIGHLSESGVSDYARNLRGFDELSGLTPAAGEDSFSLALKGQKEISLAGPVVLITSGEAGNFGSFLYRDMTKLVNVAAMPANWRFLANIGNPVFEEFLALAGLPMDRLIRHDPTAIYHIEQAIIPGLRNPYALADPQTCALYARLRRSCDTGMRGARIYVSRHSVNSGRPGGRAMLNEAELIGRLRRLGFGIIQPQYLSAREQIATFASAGLVVGPSGAGMFNAVFCHPGTRLIDIESEPHWIYPHCGLFASAGLRYGIFEGRAQDRDFSVHHKPWRVNIEALLKRIASFV